MAQQTAQDEDAGLHIPCVHVDVDVDMQVVTNLLDFAWKQALPGPHRLPAGALELGLGSDGKPIYATMCKTYVHQGLTASSPQPISLLISYNMHLAACVPASLDASCLPI